MRGNVDIAACPSRETWSAFYFGRVEAQALSTLSEHLGACPTCVEVLETVRSAGDDVLVQELRNAGTPDPFENEPHCRAALQALQNLVVDSANSVKPKPADNEVIPERLGEYRLLGRLGRGGMGAVYHAVHERLNRLVALKTFPPGRSHDAASAARFHREMAALGKLDHPHIVRATDAGEAGGVSFLVMEMVNGIDLSCLVQARGRLAVADACELARQTAIGLQYIASQGFVHRDVKPSNLMITREGTVKILDLGLAFVPQEFGPGPADLTETGQVIGTVDYMAPEQADHSRGVDCRTDVYSLGCTLFFLLAGRAPFDSAYYPTMRAKLTAHASVRVPSLQAIRNDMPAGLTDVIERMMEKDAAGRHASPAEAASALQPFCAGADLKSLFSLSPRPAFEERVPKLAEVGTNPTLAHETKNVPRRGRRRPRTIVGAVVVALIVAGFVAAALHERKLKDGRGSAGEKSDPQSPPALRAPSAHPVAIFPFDGRDRDSQVLGRSVSDLLFARLSGQPELLLVERAELQKSLEELQLGGSGAVKPESAGRVGQITGAKILITGSVLRVDKKLHLIAKIIGTETSRVLGASVNGPADAELDKLVDSLAAEIMGSVAEKTTLLVPTAVSEADRAAGVRAKLGNRPRPVLSVRVEVENDQATPALTEFIRLAQDAGFEVADFDSGPRAAVEVQVSVIAEVAPPRGNLIPAKARVQAKAVDRATGKVLAADRQTAVVVDLTPTLACKAATESAALILAERVLVQCVPGKP